MYVEGDNMIKIGEFSKLAKTTIKALRYYDEIGLFKPAFVDDNGYRYYEISQINVLSLILQLRKLDMSIEDIRKIIEKQNVLEVMNSHLKDLKEEIKLKNHQIKLIKGFIEKAEKGVFMKNYEVKEIVVPSNIVYYKHGIIPTMDKMFEFVLSAGEEVSKNNPGLKCKNYCYVSYTAKEYKETDIELEYVEAVESFGKESDSIKFRQEDEIKAVSIQHKGSYDGLRDAYAYILNYVREKGYKINGDIREVYIDGCWNKENEDEYLTEIQVPIL